MESKRVFFVAHLLSTQQLGVCLSSPLQVLYRFIFFTEDCMSNKPGIVLDLDPTNHQYSITALSACISLRRNALLVNFSQEDAAAHVASSLLEAECFFSMASVTQLRYPLPKNQSNTFFEVYVVCGVKS